MAMAAATATAMATGRPMKSRQPDCLRHLCGQSPCSLLNPAIGRRLARPLVGLIGMAALGAGAQESPVRPTLRLTPELGIQETLTDNSHLTTGNGKTELIT